MKLSPNDDCMLANLRNRRHFELFKKMWLRITKYTTTFWSTEILSRVDEAGFIMEVSTSFSLMENHAKISRNMFRQFQLHEDPIFKMSAGTSIRIQEKESGGQMRVFYKKNESSLKNYL